MVVAAEVAYQRETLPAFLATVSALLKDDGLALVVMTPELADNGRGLEGVEKLMRSTPDLDLVDVALGDDDDDESMGTALHT